MKIEIRDVSLTFNREPLFRKVNLVIESGDFVVIEGPSGSGKSSFLRLLNRLQEPSGGSILAGGRPVSDMEATHLRRLVGYVQQTPLVVPGNVRDNLLLPFRFRAGQDGTPVDDALLERMAHFRLDPVTLEDDASKLSVGQKQRIGIIRSLLTRPKVLLCDEPTSALDEDSATCVEDAVESLNRTESMTVLWVTHQAYEPKQVRARHLLLRPGDGFHERPRIE